MKNAPNEIVLRAKKQDSLRPEWATWWFLDGLWKCVGATHGLSKDVPDMKPDQASAWCQRKGYKTTLTENYNPSNT